MPGVGERRGWESQHSVTQPERPLITPIKRQAASSDLTSAAVSESGDRDKFPLALYTRVGNQQECPVKNESSLCLNEALMNIISERNPWIERHFSPPFFSTAGQWVTVPQQMTVGPHLNQIKLEKLFMSKLQIQNYRCRCLSLVCQVNKIINNTYVTRIIHKLSAAGNNVLLRGYIREIAQGQTKLSILNVPVCIVRSVRERERLANFFFPTPSLLASLLPWWIINALK